MKYITLVLILWSWSSCSRVAFQNDQSSSSPQTSTSGSTGDTTPDYGLFPLAWESKVPGSREWSNAIYHIITTEESQMLAQNIADDVETFCPKYRSLPEQQRLNFWGQLFVGMAKYESAWKPTSRMVETTMGTDPVTGRQVASEGLLQLSYQDERSYNLDCGFDWSKDKYLSDTDPKKTIFDPKNNLRCGIKIMARQLKRARAISLTSGVYWAVLKIGGKYTKIPEIAAITKTLPFCVQ